MELIPFRQSYAFSVLDLGVCIRLLKAIIMNNTPDTSATVLKILEKMLAKAKKWFKSNKRDRFCVMDYARSPITGEIDLIV